MPIPVKTRPSQDFVPIKEIRDGVVALKDNSFRMILMASAVNFALKSGDEQSAIILQYQNFLNSLDFSVQIFIQSRSLNIEPYLETLKQREKEQANELLKIQMKEYVDFVREFVNSTSIVNKSFFVVIPYSTATSLGSTKGNPLTDILSAIMPSKKKSAPAPDQKFEECKLQLQQRADAVIQGLARFGVRTVPLNTEELIELFFKLYNPSEMEAVKVPGEESA